MGAIITFVDVLNGRAGQWSVDFNTGGPIASITLELGQVVQGAPGTNQNLRIVIVLPFYLSRILFTTNSAIEAYIKITLLGMLWPVVLLIDLVPPIIEAVVFAVAIGALTPAVLVAALGNVLSVFVSNIFRLVYNFVITVLCLLFNKGNVCENCGCQSFS
jgi:hypothetical protein